MPRPRDGAGRGSAGYSARGREVNAAFPLQGNRTNDRYVTLYLEYLREPLSRFGGEEKEPPAAPISPFMRLPCSPLGGGGGIVFFAPLRSIDLCAVRDRCPPVAAARQGFPIL